MSEPNIAKQCSAGHFTPNVHALTTCALNARALLLPSPERLRLQGSMAIQQRYCR